MRTARLELDPALGVTAAAVAAAWNATDGPRVGQAVPGQGAREVMIRDLPDDVDAATLHPLITRLFLRAGVVVAVRPVPDADPGGLRLAIAPAAAAGAAPVARESDGVRTYGPTGLTPRPRPWPEPEDDGTGGR